jgi:hypothetical protein
MVPFFASCAKPPRNGGVCLILTSGVFTEKPLKVPGVLQRLPKVYNQTEPSVPPFFADGRRKKKKIVMKKTGRTGRTMHPKHSIYFWISLDDKPKEPTDETIEPAIFDPFESWIGINLSDCWRNLG